MDSIVVTGGAELHGQIPIAGAKNACLALMPATLLTEEPLTLMNAPRLSDIRTMTTLLQSLGAEVQSLQDGRVIALSSLGPVMTVRSDTFRVRAYGEATDSSGRIVARAWCEAVVQRTPEYVDATDAVDELPTTEANRLFGRRFEMTGFRWLSKEEV